MYQTHARAIQNRCLKDPEWVKGVVLFTSQTIQYPLYQVEKALDTIFWEGYNSNHLQNKMKRNTYKWLMKQKALPVTYIVSKSLEEQIDYFRSIPGIGTAKAGFLTQMICGTGGCLDSHNLERFKLKPTQSTRKYLENLKLIGRTTEQLWDDWCQELPMKDTRWNSGDQVSFVHYTNIENATRNFRHG